MDAQSSALEPALYDRDVTHFAIDSRDVRAGSLFFALSQPDYANNGFNGDFDDATKFVPLAFENGAVGAVVRSDRYEEHRSTLEKYGSRILQVDDAIAAFQKLAHVVHRPNRWLGRSRAFAGSSTEWNLSTRSAA